MGKIILFIASTIDGYIANNNDDISWLEQTEGEGDNGFDSMYNRISSIAMGRKTYDILCNLVGHYPHNDRESYIFTHSANSNSNTLHYVSGDVTTWITQSRVLEKGDLWLVGGGNLVQQFLEVDLIDELFLTIAPIHLGCGIPLHLPLNNTLHWRLVNAKQSGQFAQLEYHRLRSTEHN